jgi:ATP-dependent helicase/nuclease subunit A
MNLLSINQLKALDDKRNLAVTAGAGSGKTTILVQRYLNLLLNHPSLKVRNILAITFTEKATAEMKDRIFTEIHEQFARNRSQQGRLFEILNQLHEAQIFTIHAFCNHILHQFPTESEQNPEFLIMDDVHIDALLNEIFRDFLLNFNPEDQPDSSVIMRSLREYSFTRLKEIFVFFYRNRTILYPFLDKFREATPQTIRDFWQEEYLNYHSDILLEFKSDQEFWSLLDQITALHLENRSKAETIRKELSQLTESFRAEVAVSRKSIETASQILSVLTKTDGTAYQVVVGGKKSWGEEGAEMFLSLSGLASQYGGKFLPADEQTEQEYGMVAAGIISVVNELLHRSEDAKQSLNALDFEDLQIKTLAVMQQYPEVRDYLRKQYDFILVDEFQDTDRLQSGIIQLLTHDHLGNMDSHRLFIVGDPKQSIFGFRNTNVALFQDFMTKISLQSSGDLPIHLKDHSEPLKTTAEERRGIIELSQNYRSSLELLRMFNQTFEPILQEESEFDVPFQRLESGHREYLSYHSLSVLDLFLDRSDDEDNPDLIQLQATRLAERISSLVHDPGEIRKAGENGLEKIHFGDIAILIRSRTYLSRIEQTLRQFKIPYQTYKGAGFFQKQEIQDIYYILRSISMPEDDFALVTILRSHYVGLSDVCLFYLSQVRGENYWTRLNRFREYLESGSEPVEYFGEKFARFISESDPKIRLYPGEQESIEYFISLYRQWIPLALNGKFSRLLDEIIEKFQIRPLLTAQSDGDQKIANLDKLVHTIYEFEQSSSTLLSDLLELLQGQISGETREGEAVIMADDQDKVKIITFHSAKGMEFPVVFLPFMEKKFQFNRNLLLDSKYGFAIDLERSAHQFPVKPFAYRLLLERDRHKIEAEEKRLLYVAMTRARDHLFMTAALKKSATCPVPSYLNWLLSAHEVLEGHDLANLQEAGMISKPALEVNIDIISGSVQSESGITPDITEPTDQEKFLSEDLLKYMAPLHDSPDGYTYTVTQLMLFRESRQRYLDHYYLNEGEIPWLDTSDSFIDEPGGALWGSLIHKLLENFQLRPPDDDLKKIEQLLTVFPISQDQNREELEKSLISFIRNFRGSPLAGDIQSRETFSEYALEMRINQFTLRGIFDMLCRDRQGLWGVVDYKTNRVTAGETDSLAKKYDFQLRAYALLLSGLHPDQPVFPVSLFFLEPMKMVKRDFNRLEIESTRNETGMLLQELFAWESALLHPATRSGEK